jgi:ABC-type enterochelin transport system permease subunit
VSVMSEARRRGALTCYMALRPHMGQRTEGWVAVEYASVVKSPHEFSFVCELDIHE